ncbi:MAG: RagB/SusD family nutrient uptake outer membrane protein [Paludibacter sp.]
MKKYNMVLTKIFFVLPIILLSILSSCSDDVLKEKPLDFLAPENAYTTVPGIKQGIAGLHSKLRNCFYSPNAAIGGVEEIFCLWNGGAGTDMVYNGENPAKQSRFFIDYQVFLTPTQNVSDIWNNAYIIVASANLLAESIKSADPAIWKDEAQKNAYLAEALFFRAHAYRMLVNFYGDVPLINEALHAPKADYVRAPKADVYKLMEDDLNFGVANLPKRGKEEGPGRITQAAALHMLSEVYICDGKFQLAVDAASQVIDGGEYKLMTARFGARNDIFGTGDVFLDLFYFGNQNLPENTENIWSIQFEPNILGGSGGFAGERAWGPRYYDGLLKTPDSKPAYVSTMQTGGTLANISDSLGRGVAWCRPTNYTAYTIWQSDWKNDIRNAKHNIKRDFYYDSPTSTYHKKKIDLTNAFYKKELSKDTNNLIFPYLMKHVSPFKWFTDLDLRGAGFNHKDVYAIRVAETILLRAEAYVRLGKTAEAAADINLIRNRANAKPIGAAQANIDYICDERARELWGEEQRWITLHRMGNLVKRTRDNNSNPYYPGLNIQDNNNLFPIPQKAIDNNIGAVIEQNPGY